MTKYCIVFYIFDEFNRLWGKIMVAENNSSDSNDNEFSELIPGYYPRTFAAAFIVDGYFSSVFNRLLNISENYSNMVLNNFSNKYPQPDSEISVRFQLVKPKSDILDYAWSERLCRLLVERQELEYAMSWLSTLGGAFSALGDNFENCAKIAGKISIEQFKIAFRLGDPPLVARCRLYMALSLIQLGKLSTAKTVIQQQFVLAKTFNDFRLQNMCKGIWAKLQYIYKQKKISKKKKVL